MPYTPSQLRVLHCLRRHGGKLLVGKTVKHIYSYIEEEMHMQNSSVRTALRELEAASIVIRTFKRPVTGFAGGPNTLIRVEMVDPKMPLPPCPPLPLAVVIARENAELAERTAHEPERDDVIEALLVRNEELQGQIEKLQSVVEKLNDELESLRKKESRKKVPEHLTQRLQDALTPEKWEELRHE
jgi:DNA-binding transcriptional regulator GbsR (MarR family)